MITQKQLDLLKHMADYFEMMTVFMVPSEKTQFMNMFRIELERRRLAKAVQAAG